jgi:hypothetical protein
MFNNFFPKNVEKYGAAKQATDDKQFGACA